MFFPYDKICLCIFIILASTLMGLGIVNVIDKKISNVSIQIPEINIPKPTVILNGKTLNDITADITYKTGKEGFYVLEGEDTGKAKEKQMDFCEQYNKNKIDLRKLLTDCEAKKQIKCPSAYDTNPFTGGSVSNPKDAVVDYDVSNLQITNKKKYCRHVNDIRKTTTNTRNLTSNNTSTNTRNGLTSNNASTNKLTNASTNMRSRNMLTSANTRRECLPNFSAMSRNRFREHIPTYLDGPVTVGANIGDYWSRADPKKWKSELPTKNDENMLVKTPLPANVVLPEKNIC